MDRESLGQLVAKAFREARKEGLSIEDAGRIVADVIIDKLEESGESEADANSDVLQYQGIFGAKSGLPLVDFRVGLEHWTMQIEAAQKMALGIITVAEAATQDAMMYRWLTIGNLGLPADAAAQAIFDLRRFRGDSSPEDWRTPEQKAWSEQPS